MKSQINIDNNFSSFKDSFYQEVNRKSHHRNFSEMSGAYLSEAKISLINDLNLLQIKDKVININKVPKLKIRNSKRPSEIKSETATISLNTNKTKFLEMSPVKNQTIIKNKLNLTKIKIKIPSKMFSVLLQSDDENVNVNLQNLKFPNIKNETDKKLQTQVKFEKEHKKLCEKYEKSKENKKDLIYVTNVDSNYKSIHNFVIKNKSHVNFLNLRGKHLDRSQDSKIDSFSNRKEDMQNVGEVNSRYIEMTSYIKNLKKTFYSIDKSKMNYNLVNLQPNFDSFASQINNYKIKSESIKNINSRVPPLRRGINEINPTDFESSSEYLNHVQRNVQINFKRKFPEYKRIKNYDSQIKMNEVISFPDYKKSNIISLAIKKPYFHINRKICFSHLLNDRQALFKIHHKNMKSLKMRLNNFKDLESE
jgi:hypothetical protein